MDDGVPVLTAVREPYKQAWSDFHGGLAVTLPEDLAVVLDWCRAAVARRRTARDCAPASAV